MAKSRSVRVQDLPRPRPSTALPGGGTLIARQPLLYCSACGVEFSADPGDYWAADPRTIFRHCGRLMALVDKRTTYVPVTT